jgi:cell division septation protein DedD
MDINYKQDQFELFPGAPSGSSSPQPPPRFLFSSVTLSGENIIVLTVFIFLVIIVSFSVGVERGKSFAARSVSVVDQATALKTQVVQKPVNVPNSNVVSRPQTQVPPAPSKIAQQNVVVQKNTAPAAAVKSVSPSVFGGFYTVQVASFKKQEFAEDEAHGLKAKGYETFIVPKGQHLIVCAGRFGDQGEAKVFSGKLKSKYKDCLVRRL